MKAIEEIMTKILAFGNSFQNGSHRELAEEEYEIKEAIEQYAKDRRESMRKECIAACEKERVSDHEVSYGYPYNDAIDDMTLAMREIK